MISKENNNNNKEIKNKLNNNMTKVRYGKKFIDNIQIQR